MDRINSSVNTTLPEIIVALHGQAVTFDMICAEAAKRGMLAYQLAPNAMMEISGFFAAWHTQMNTAEQKHGFR